VPLVTTVTGARAWQPPGSSVSQSGGQRCRRNGRCLGSVARERCRTDSLSHAAAAMFVATTGWCNQTDQHPAAAVRQYRISRASSGLLIAGGAEIAFTREGSAPLKRPLAYQYKLGLISTPGSPRAQRSAPAGNTIG